MFLRNLITLTKFQELDEIGPVSKMHECSGYFVTPSDEETMDTTERELKRVKRVKRAQPVIE